MNDDIQNFDILMARWSDGSGEPEIFYRALTPAQRELFDWMEKTKGMMHEVVNINNLDADNPKHR